MFQATTKNEIVIITSIKLFIQHEVNNYYFVHSWFVGQWMGIAAV